MSGSTEFEGRVEICLSGRWGTVCDQSWDDIDASVVCQQLAMANPGSAVARRGAVFGEGSHLPIVMAEVACVGGESQLSSCTHNGASDIGLCSHSNDAGVQCAARKNTVAIAYALHLSLRAL